MTDAVIRQRPRKLEPYPLPRWLQFYVEQYAGRVPLWTFPHLPPTEQLSFERLEFENRGLVLDMFDSDASSFVDASFKSDEQLYTYVAQQWICGPHSPKHGSADWVVLRRCDGEPVGLLHAYELSRETFACAHRRCFVGYAFSEAYRGTGLAHEALTALETYLLEGLDMLVLVANPRIDNVRSIRFLERRGYVDCTQDYLGQRDTRFFRLHRASETNRPVAKVIPPIG